jgi:2-oxoglutarate dehydrogenase E2 component (dihydrolipoamide succinyltransferase)
MKVEFKMPKMGESITEATIINWLKKVGDTVVAEETIVEVATDKVDNDVPSPVSGVITEIRFGKDDIVKVGEVLALIEADSQVSKVESQASAQPTATGQTSDVKRQTTDNRQPPTDNRQSKSNPDAFLSPLIISIAQKENLSIEEVQSIPGSGADGRIQKVMFSIT